MGLHHDEPPQWNSLCRCDDNLARRVWEHRKGVIGGFTKQYGLKKLVFAERHATVLLAIQREHNIKHWPRRWKLNVITAQNPEWADLYDQIL